VLFPIQPVFSFNLRVQIPDLPEGHDESMFQVNSTEPFSGAKITN
jgi:hypothetical protein